MGHCKFKFHKNYERKRQAMKNEVGPPTKAGNVTISWRCNCHRSLTSKQWTSVFCKVLISSYILTLESLHSSLSLPRGWIVEAEEEKLILCKLQQCVASTSRCKQPMAISHCLEVNKDMTWMLFVHEKKWIQKIAVQFIVLKTMLTSIIL